MPDLDNYYGVVVIDNTTQPPDGGACYIGQRDLVVNNVKHRLACVWFDPNSLFTGFAAHEIAHGLGLDHSFDDSQRNCGGAPGEYCDPWDIMSALGTYQFVDRNWLIGGSSSGGGPGMNAPALLRMGWMPSTNVQHFQNEGDEQKFTIRALSHPHGADPLVVALDVGSTDPFGGIFTVEYRQGDGWDRGFVTNTDAPATVKLFGGAVLVHQFRPAGPPASVLVRGSFGGAMEPSDNLVLIGRDGVVFHITVDAIDTKAGTATVSIGFGRGHPPRVKPVLTTPSANIDHHASQSLVP